MEIYSPVGEHDRPDGAVLPPELHPLRPRAGLKALVQGAGARTRRRWWHSNFPPATMFPTPG